MRFTRVFVLALALAAILIGVGALYARGRGLQQPAIVGSWAGKGRFTTLDFWPNGQWSGDSKTSTIVSQWKQLDGNSLRITYPPADKYSTRNETWAWSVSADDQELTVDFPTGERQKFTRVGRYKNTGYWPRLN